MPTRTDPSVSPGERTHSCSSVYFRSSGYTALLEVGSDWSARYRGSPWLGILRRARLSHGGDVERVELLHVDRGVGVIELGDRPVHEVGCPVQRVRVADGVEHGRRRHTRAIDLHAAG